MNASYELERILAKVRKDQLRYGKRFLDLEDSTTLFDRFTHEKIECVAKIEVLEEMELWLLKELQKTKVLEEIEL